MEKEETVLEKSKAQKTQPIKISTLEHNPATDVNTDPPTVANSPAVDASMIRDNIQ